MFWCVCMYIYVYLKILNFFCRGGFWFEHLAKQWCHLLRWGKIIDKREDGMSIPKLSYSKSNTQM